jgi:hypothetical protein
VSVAAFVSFTYRCVALPTFASILTIGVKTASRSSYMYTFWFLSICTLRLAVTPLIHRRRTRSKRRLEAFNQIGTPVFRMVRSRRRPKSSRMTIDAVVMTARFRLPHRIISSVLVSPKSKHCITDQVRDWSCVRTRAVAPLASRRFPRQRSQAHKSTVFWPQDPHYLPQTHK